MVVVVVVFVFCMTFWAAKQLHKEVEGSCGSAAAAISPGVLARVFAPPL